MVFSLIINLYLYIKAFIKKKRNFILNRIFFTCNYAYNYMYIGVHL